MYIPDNYDAFRQHEAEQESWLARRPKCDCCGEHIQDDFLYDLNGVIHCEKCLNETFRHSSEDYER